MFELLTFYSSWIWNELNRNSYNVQNLYLLNDYRLGVWRAPVILRLGGPLWRLIWGWDHCWIVFYVEQESALSLASTLERKRSRPLPGCLSMSESGQGGNSAAQSSHVGAVVGSRQWVAAFQQPNQYSKTYNFFSLSTSISIPIGAFISIFPAINET